MYQNMTREEMIQRLYDGNFTTGELERQLIAKLFEQCCGGGSGSSGGGVLIVHEGYDEETHVATLDKTAAEIFEAVKNGVAILATQTEEGDEGLLGFRSACFFEARRYQGVYTFTTFEYDDTTASGEVIAYPYKFYATNDNDYPTDQQPSGGGGTNL